MRKTQAKVISLSGYRRRLNPDHFAKTPIWLAERASEVCKSSALLLVLTRMLYLAWEAKGGTFRLSTSWLEERGVSQRTKNRVLRDLEAGGLIEVRRAANHSPDVTFIVL
jgi:DNA-binding MarR family transcriptional regulator